ncbi:MAG: hypothetical protein ACRC5A_13215 [Enterobacteriaceae bacterium]
MNRNHVMISRQFQTIQQRDFPLVVANMKTACRTLSLHSDDIAYKLEFICEELLTNSFTHALGRGQLINLLIELHEGPLTLFYTAEGGGRLNLDDLLPVNRAEAVVMGEEKTLNAGGLGLQLIKQIAQSFTCQYDPLRRANQFKVII